MPSFDREAALKSAEKALRLGRIDRAIAEYQRIVEHHARDWNSANALGDLYVRAGQVDKGIAEYTRIADALALEGFYPKSAALFKKILKIRPGEEYALLQLGELSATQGLLADAKQAFKTVADRRRAAGDARGAAELDIRCGTLDPDDLDARLLAARAATEIGDTERALTEYRDLAQRFEQAGRTADLLAVLEAIVGLDAADTGTRAVLARTYATQGDLTRAGEYLTAEAAGDNAGLWLTLAEIELNAGRLDEGRAAVAKALALDEGVRGDVVALGCRLVERSADAAYPCFDAVADHDVAKGEFAAAAAALHEFAARVQHHLIALVRLVEICVDGGLETAMYEAQALLADAYLEAGRGLEARIISEDLVAHDPRNSAHLDRFRRALVVMGEADPEAIIAERLSGESPFLTTDELDLNEGVFFDDGPSTEAAPTRAPSSPPPAPAAPAAKPPKGGARGKDAARNEEPPAATTPAPSAPVPPTPATAAAPGEPSPAPAAQGAEPPKRSLEQVFREISEEVTATPDEEAAAEQYALGVTYHELGMDDDAIEVLEDAARSPRQRFLAASLLGRVLKERGDWVAAVEWFERAAEAPPSDPDAGRTLLYDLADTLEQLGEHGRALAVFVELEAECRGYRDVARRIDRLSTIQAKG